MVIKIYNFIKREITVYLELRFKNIFTGWNKQWNIFINSLLSKLTLENIRLKYKAMIISYYGNSLWIDKLIKLNS